MNRPRLILVAPRYWPHCGESECIAANLAAGLSELGADVTVLTGSWRPDWPKYLVVRGVRVVRVPHAPRGGWHMFRYMTALSRWLREHRQEYDLVYALNLRQEAYVAVRAGRGTGAPTVLRAQEWGPAGDGWWQAHTRFGARIQRECMDSAAIIAANSMVSDELAGYGYPSHRLHVIPLGVAAGDPRSADRRNRARAALADAHPDLATAEYSPVAVMAGRLEDAAALSDIVRAWRDVTARWASARLWLIGDGAAREPVGEQLKELELRHQVCLPGTFEDWTDLFHAADLFIWPAPHSGRQTLLEAMAAGLPVVAAEAPDLRAMMVHGQHGLLVPPHSPAAWSAAVSQILEAPQFGAELGAAAAKLVRARFSRRRMAEMHWELFEPLLPRHRP